MFEKFKRKPKPTPEPTPLEKEMARVLNKMKKTDPLTQEYQTLLARYIRLDEMHPEPVDRRPSPDAVLYAGTAAAQILGILIFEKTTALTTKAIGYVFRPQPQLPRINR